MNLGETIYRLRTKAGMSQDALANALDVSRQSVSKWENNAAVPELDKLMKLSEIFGVTLDELVGRESPAAPAAPLAQSPPPYRTIGAILLGFGLLTTLLLSILGGFIVGVFLGTPFTIVGSILLSNSKEPFFHATWGIFAVYAPVGFFFMLNFMGFGIYLKLGVIAVWFVILSLWAIIRHMKGKLSDESRKFIRGSLIIALVLAVLLSIATPIMHRRSGLMSTNEPQDVSIVEMN